MGARKLVNALGVCLALAWPTEAQEGSSSGNVCKDESIWEEVLGIIDPVCIWDNDQRLQCQEVMMKAVQRLLEEGCFESLSKLWLTFHPLPESTDLVASMKEEHE